LRVLRSNNLWEDERKDFLFLRLAPARDSGTHPGEMVVQISIEISRYLDITISVKQISLLIWWDNALYSTKLVFWKNYILYIYIYIYIYISHLTLVNNNITVSYNFPLNCNITLQLYNTEQLHYWVGNYNQ